MEIAILLKGLILGFSIAAPIGPIGLLCIRRTLSTGRLSGFVFGLGTATADALYGALAAFGVTAVTGLLLDYQPYIRLAGGGFLCYLGISIFRAEPAVQAVMAPAKDLLAAYGAAFLLTLANPMTILAFAAVFAGLGIGVTSGGGFSAAILIVGVFCGSALWWLVLTGTATFLFARMNYQRLKRINHLAGLIILGFGLVCIFGL